MDATTLLAGARIVPVVVIDDADAAVPLARTLVDAGLGFVEVTLRTPCALDALAAIAADVPECVPGVGSVRRPEQLDAARRAGARFAVSPGFTHALLDAAGDLPLVPGAATAAEVMQLLERGYRLQKFFPAEVAGGVAALRALSAPLPEARFFPTGGITTALAPAYLGLDCVACIGGSWIAPPALLASRDFERIGRLAADAAALG